MVSKLANLHLSVLSSLFYFLHKNKPLFSRTNNNTYNDHIFISFSSKNPGDEMFSDSFKMKLVDDVIYEVYGKLVSRSQDEITIAGSNPSAEEADEGTDLTTESGVDIVLNHRLCETYAFGDKKSFTLYLKDYMKK